MNLYVDLFWTFARIGGLTFGGGYAMLPMLQREVVEKRNWATDEELMEQIKERERLIEDPTLSNALRAEGIVEVETLRELLYYRKLARTYMNA